MTKTKTKKIRTALLAFALAAVTVISSVCVVSADDLTDQKKALNSMKDNYQRALEQRNELQKSLTSKRAAIKTKQDEKYLLDSEITVLTEQVMTAESLIDEYSLYIAEKEQEKAELEKKYSEQQELLGEMLRMSYKYGDESYIDIILGANSISDFIQRLDFLAYHMKYSSTLMGEMQKTADNLSEVTASLSAALDSTTAVRDEMEEAKKELSDKLVKVEALISELAADEKDAASLLSQKEIDMKAIEKDIAELTKAIAAQENPNAKPYSGGLLNWPLKGYSMKNLTSSYGTRRDPITGKAGAFHNGLDVGAPYGTKIYSAESGTVVRASWYGTYGNCVIIDHGNGLMTLYAHCSGYNVKVGQYVEKDAVIAYVGSTGRSTGNHLHFTVFVNGKTTDPAAYLS